MKISVLLLSVTIAAAVVVLSAQEQDHLKLVQTIPLPNVTGRIDHLTFDAKANRLFIAALGNNTLEDIDLRAGKRIHQIPGLDEPQGLAYVPEFERLFVASGGDGTCKIYSNDLRVVNTVKFSDDADNVRYDVKAKRIYVGYGKGALGIIDAKDIKRVGDIMLDGHPESFQLESSGSRIFVNVPTAKHIAVVDRNKRTIITKWPLTEYQSNYPMALDEPNRRLFVGTRRPARLVVLDTATGKIVTALKCGEDTDDVFYDAARKHIYVICGEGVVNVFERRDVNTYKEISTIHTASGARTGLFVSALNRLFVAVPHRDKQQSAVQVFETQ